jgi:hypothetical protein
MRDLQLELQVRAEACRFASENAATPEQRELFDILTVLWTALADDCRTYGDWHIAEEVREVSALHAQALTAAQPTLH